MKKSIKKNLLSIISILLSFFMIIFFIEKESGFKSLIEMIRTLDKKFLFFCIICILIYWFLDGYVLFIFTKEKNKNQHFIDSLKTAMIGLFYSAITPFATGGQPMQVIEMNKKGLKTFESMSIITIKSIVYQVSLTVYAFISLIFVRKIMLKEIKNFYFFVILGFFINIIFILIFLLIFINSEFTKKILLNIINFLSKIHLIKNVEALKEKTNIEIDSFHKSSKIVTENPFLIFKAFFFTFVQLTFFFLIPFMIYRSFGLNDFKFFKMIFIQSILYIVTAFIPTPGGSGAAEGSFYLFFKMFFSEDLIFHAIFIWRFITYYMCIIVGGLVYLFDIIKIPKLKKIKNL